MKLGLLQFFPVRFNVEENLQFIESSLEGCEADLIVLPEMALTGYLFPSREILSKYAEEVPGPSVKRLEKLCKKFHFTLVFGMPEKDGGNIYNSAVAVGPDGYITKYRKLHLFSDEKDFFERGKEPPPIFEVAKAKVGILICFDWIFPEAARMLAILGADIIAHTSNLVLPYAQSAVVTRCIENRIFWVLANRTGSEKEGEKEYVYTGMSRIVDPYGRVLVECLPEDPSLAIVEIEPEMARNKRITPRNDIFQDRRTDVYRLQ